jgi:hypothetical protein
MMNWYEWETQEDFDLWHEALCDQLGYPIVSVNQATGEPDESAAMTTAYTTSREVEGKIIADVEEKYAEGLTLTDLRPALRVFSDEA